VFRHLPHLASVTPSRMQITPPLGLTDNSRAPKQHRYGLRDVLAVTSNALLHPSQSTLSEAIPGHSKTFQLRARGNPCFARLDLEGIPHVHLRQTSENGQ